ncbi:MAG: hypothetical protein KDI30_05865 [Pseudomonadales bacterium]|nr:hypothetical protein [Pseudomonadales bacterium]
MNDKQLLFAFGVGLLTALMGVLIVFISQAGWNLLAVGFTLLVLASISKLTRRTTPQKTVIRLQSKPVEPQHD